jgi:Gram-negative bacterial TonB protein C-terminal
VTYSRATTSILITLIVSSSFSVAADSMADLPKKVAKRSQITAPGSHPFVLKARILEVTKPSNPSYQAEIEEYWVAPDKWRRVVKASSFSQILVVNGDRISEQLTGDYYPNWLRTIVAAIFDPGAALTEGFGLSHAPMLKGEKFCQRITFMAGIAPVSNNVSSSFCLDDGLLVFVDKPGYEVAYKNYGYFARKYVAYMVSETIDPGAVVEATIDTLTELKSPDDAMFAIQDGSALLQTIRADEQTLRSLAASAPDIVWPTDRGGADKGTLSLYICVDRNGHVREAYKLNSSNPALSEVARDQVMKWQFKPASSQGVPVQVESILTFAFNTASADHK